MQVLTIQSNISWEQLWELLRQLPLEQKMKLANQLRAEVADQEWAALSQALPDVPAISQEEIVSEVKAVRHKRAQEGH